jgi:hypothetical protein
MAINVSEAPEIERIFERLGILPQGQITILPDNLVTSHGVNDFLFGDGVDELLKVSRAENLDVVTLTEPRELIQLNALEWILPTIHILNSAGAIAEFTMLVKLLIANVFGGDADRRVRLRVYKKTAKTTKAIDYDGSAEGLRELSEILKSL